MKKLSILIITGLIIYSIYYDLRTGTLPVSQAVKAVADVAAGKASNKTEGNHFIQVEAKAGDTVLSLVEQNNQGNLPVSINEVITDFKKLNNGVEPEKIQIGKKYNIPLYK